MENSDPFPPSVPLPPLPKSLYELDQHLISYYNTSPANNFSNKHTILLLLELHNNWVVL